ncbi:uncharacterized protein LOC127840790 [Dreissena polymorpha]|uniref:uncharacterized protein LOC127840790 n=1 Tax=Dreissena polymorpha TaxID=45954 RepID=UPI002264EBA8|nr:uncharacterized protein LOC127840790 [Dreissena polymorpha]
MHEQGVYWRNECGFQPLLPYWMIISALSPFLLLPFIKAVKDPYFGVTCWRALSVALYLVFFAWLITGSIWNFETFKSATDAQCKKVLKIYALALTCVHWLLFALATIPQVYILTKVCCCCTENAIRPLKPHMNVEENI